MSGEEWSWMLAVILVVIAAAVAGLYMMIDYVARSEENQDDIEDLLKGKR